MNFVAFHLLVNLSEHDAFWALAYVSDTLLPGYYCPTLAGLQADAAAVERLAGRHLPQQLEQLSALGVPLTLVSAQWCARVVTDAGCFSTAFRSPTATAFPRHSAG